MAERARRARTSRAGRALVESLEWLSGPLAARRVIGETLLEARLDELPSDREAVVGFVRQHVLQLVHDALGPGEAAALLTRFLATLEDLPIVDPDEAHPADSGLRRATSPEARPTSARGRLWVLLVCGDRLERLWLARMLVRAAFDVLVVERFVDLATLEGPLPSLSLVDMSTAHVGVILEGMALRRPDVRVVAVGEGDADALLAVEETLLRAGVYRYEVRSCETRGAELAIALRQQAAD